MKNFINLLPKEDQQEIQLEKINTVFLNFFIWVIISLVIVSLLFFGARIYLDSQFEQTIDQIELRRQILSQQENKDLKEKLIEFNTTLNNLVVLNKYQGFWSDVLINFSRLVPSDIAIDSLVADRVSGAIRISGFAGTRESVLKLRENLLDSDYFGNVNFPLSNLVSPTNVEFRYTFFVNPEKLLPNKKD